MHLYRDGIQVDADEVALPPTTSAGNHTSSPLYNGDCPPPQFCGELPSPEW